MLHEVKPHTCSDPVHWLCAGSCSTSPSRREQPLFSLRQVGMICERLLKEREEKIREEYNEILTSKLAGILGTPLEKPRCVKRWSLNEFYSHVVVFFPEQYDAFVKFTHDQLMRRFGEQPASCK